MRRVACLVLLAAVVAVVAGGALPAQAGGRHGGGSLFFSNGGLTVSTGVFRGSSLFSAHGSPGFSFWIGSAPWGSHYRHNGGHYYRYSRRGHHYRRPHLLGRLNYGQRYFGRPHRFGHNYRHGGGIHISTFVGSSYNRPPSRHYGGFYGRFNGRAYGEKRLPPRRVWVPGRMTPGGYLKGYWGTASP